MTTDCSSILRVEYNFCIKGFSSQETFCSEIPYLTLTFEIVIRIIDKTKMNDE